MLPTAAPQLISGHPLIRRLCKIVGELGLERRDFVIFGSAPLLAYGVRRHVGDLDVVARGRTWERVRQSGLPAYGALNGAPMAVFCGGAIQFSAGWISSDWMADDLIDRADVIGGLRFARLAEVVKYKKMLGRPKDRADIEAVEELVRGRDELDCSYICAPMN